MSGQIPDIASEKIIKELMSWGWIYETIFNPKTWEHESIMRNNWEYYTIEEAVAWYNNYMGA